mgnify:CR=1 FL=1
MNAEAIITVSAAVIALVQLIKWSGLVAADKSPVAVLVLSLIGIIFYRLSGPPLEWVDAWPIFAAWIATATSAAGTFGFVREAPDTVMSFKK